MKKSLIIFTVLLTTALHAQSWQWAKSGGGSSNPDGTNGSIGGENVRSIAVDHQNNIYTLSAISSLNFKLDGVNMPSYGLTNNGATPCALLASYTCDGSFRWSKVIGGHGGAIVRNVQTDNIGNVYIAATLNISYPDSEPVHIGNDTILPVNEGNHNRRLYIFKYDTNGNFLWLKSPQSETTTQIGVQGSSSLNMVVDPQGNSYWLCSLSPETYCEGALVINNYGRYILKYDADGNYVGHIFIDYPNPNALFELSRNHNNGNLYLVGDNDTYPFEPFYINGQPINHSKFIIAFDSNGTFQWIRENEATGLWSSNIESKKLVFDSENNIYFTTAILYTNIDNMELDSFAGVQIGGEEYQRHPFVMKLDPNGNPIWTTSSNRAHPTSISISNSEVSISSFLLGSLYVFSWGNISIPLGTMKPSLFRFNKDNGNIIAINPLNNTANVYDNNSPYALAVDHNNNYYMGGQFSSSIITDAGTITSNGGSTDFYIAKFGTSNCAPLETENHDFKNIKVFPNPVKKFLYFNNKENLKFQLYNLLGEKIKSGSLQIDANLNLESLTNGMYLLKLQNNSGEQMNIKVLKE